MFVPVVDKDQKPLMPTTPARARRWVESGKATPFFKKGVFCVRLNQEPSDRKTQPIAVGIDPGSKREGLTAASEVHTYINLHAEAVTHVKAKVEARRNTRRARRQRNTPCRQNRMNRRHAGVAPSTKARWQWKLRLLRWIAQMMPVTHVGVEDIKAVTRGQRRWDRSFSPLQVGKQWFYAEIEKDFKLTTREGFFTFELRTQLGLTKTKNKLAVDFNAHCVDSWVLAHSVVGGALVPDNTGLVQVIPLQLHRRQLHRFQHGKNGKRPRYGGTRSLDLKRGSVVRHPKHGKCFVGGSSNGTISLHSNADGSRITKTAKRPDVQFRTYSAWRTILPERTSAVG